jgi:hypothetical protein
MSQSSIAECNAALDARNAKLNSGTVEIRTGPAADIDATPTGTVRATFSLPLPAFSPAALRSVSMNAVTPAAATAANAGTEVHYVARESGGAVSRVGSAGTSAADMILNTLTWSIGDDVSITAWSTSQPK